MPATRNLTAYRGDTFAHTIDWTSGGTPLDVSSWTWLCQVRSSSESSAVVATITTDTTDADTGTLVLRLTAEETEALPPGSLRWDLQGTDAGSVTTWLAGSFVVEGDVSRV